MPFLSQQCDAMRFASAFQSYSIVEPIVAHQAINRFRIDPRRTDVEFAMYRFPPRRQNGMKIFRTNFERRQTEPQLKTCNHVTPK